MLRTQCMVLLILLLNVGLSFAWNDAAFQYITLQGPTTADGQVGYTGGLLTLQQLGITLPVTNSSAVYGIPYAQADGTLHASWFPSGGVAPSAHASTHKNGGSDEVATATSAANAIPKAGSDGKLSIGWLPTSGVTPTAHASTHQNGGADEVATATAAANAIPKAGAGGTLAIGWIPTGTSGSTTALGNDARFLASPSAPVNTFRVVYDTNSAYAETASSSAAYQVPSVNSGQTAVAFGLLTTNNLSATAGITGGQIASGTITATNISGSAGITEAMLTLADNTTLDVSTSKHGLVPKGTGSTTQYLRADGTYATPAGTAGANLYIATHFINLNAYNLAATTNKVTITADAVDVTNGTTVTRVNSVSVVLDISASGANGLNTGTEAASTHYAGYLITQDSGGTPAGLASLTYNNTTGPGSLPSGYTHWALLTSFRNDGSSNIIPYNQRGLVGYIATPTQVVSGGSAGSVTKVDCSAVVPTIASHAICYARVTGGTSGYLEVDDPLVSHQIGYVSGPTAIADVYAPPIFWPLDGSRNIAYERASGNATCDIWACGWVLNQ